VSDKGAGQTQPTLFGPVHLFSLSVASLFLSLPFFYLLLISAKQWPPSPGLGRTVSFPVEVQGGASGAKAFLVNFEVRKCVR